MEQYDETLLFLPGWCIANQQQLSEMLVSVGNGVSNVTVAIVSIDQDTISQIYEHSRISGHIVDRIEIMKLLVMHQVTRLPYSLSVVSQKNRSHKDSSTSALIFDKSGISNNFWSLASCCYGQYHMLAPTESTAIATDLFSKAIDAYDAFDFAESATNFYSAISLDARYKSALFNFAGLLHMVGYPILSIYYIEQVLLLDHEDMISHSFLWAMVQLPGITSVGRFFHTKRHYNFQQQFKLRLFNLWYKLEKFHRYANDFLSIHID